MFFDPPELGFLQVIVEPFFTLLNTGGFEVGQSQKSTFTILLISLIVFPVSVTATT